MGSDLTAVDRLRLDGVTKRLRQKAAGERNSFGDLWGDWICSEPADEIERLIAHVDRAAARITELEAALAAERAKREEAERERDRANELLGGDEMVERAVLSAMAIDALNTDLATERAAIEAAEAEAARLREALIPFAEAAEYYDPPEDDDGLEAFRHRFRMGDLRKARAAPGSRT